jgi:phage/plasmid primase-like uncharacterized protein
MNAHEINQTYDLLALAQRDTKLKRAGSYYIGPCPFCGGRDRFTLKQTPDGWRWYCRHCGGETYHTAIDYIMRRDDLDFKQALDSMGGTAAPHPRAAMQSAEIPAMAIPDATWQAHHWREIEQASLELEYSKAAQIARDYLHARALDPATWLVYLLGFAVVYKRPAIVIPWFDSDWTITAIKYRFIDDLAKRDTGRRFGMAEGSKPILFGLHAATSHDTLVLCEGEINAMSISQISVNTLPGLDALSFGSQSGGRAEILREVARDYQRVIVWADEPEKATEIKQSLARPAEALCSPVIDGTKYDANALLQNGDLAEFLQETIEHSS